MGHWRQADWRLVFCGEVQLVLLLLLLGLQEIQKSLRDDLPEVGGCNGDSFLVGQKLGQRRLKWVEF